MEKNNFFAVRLVQESDLAVLSKIYSRVFSEADPEKPWDIEHSYNHLLYWFKIQPDMFFGAFDEDHRPIGATAVGIKPWRRGNRCFAGIIFVDSRSQKRNVAKALFRRMIQEAIQKYQARSFEAITFAGKDFPRNWYERVGLMPDKGSLLMKGSCLGIFEKLA